MHSLGQGIVGFAAASIALLCAGTDRHVLDPQTVMLIELRGAEGACSMMSLYLPSAV
jgi:hypothetical protein